MRSSTRQDWLAAVALLVGAMAAYLVPPATTGHGAARAVAAMAIGALLALAVARAPFTFAPKVRSGFALLVALSLWYICSRAWAIDPGGSMVESSRVAAFVLMAWAAHTAVTGVAARRLLLAGVTGCGLFAALPFAKDLVQDGAPTVRMVGELGYWNATSIVALTLMPVAVALAGTARRRWIILAALCVPLAGIAAVATASRGALVALALGLLVQAVLDPDYRGGLPRALVAAGGIGLVIAGLAVDGMPEAIALIGPALLAGAGFAAIKHRRKQALELRAVPDPKPRRPMPKGAQLLGGALIAALVVVLVALVYDANDAAIEQAQQAAPGSDVGRLTSTDDSKRYDWWHEGFDLWKGAPIIGEGGGAFDANHLDVPGDSVEHVHSMPLEVLIETGAIGALLLLAASIQFLRVLRRGRRSAERALAGAVAVMLLAQSTLDWTLSLPQVLVVLALAGPLALPDPPVPEEEIEQAPIVSVGMLASLAVATLAALTPMLAALLSEQAGEQFDAGRPLRAAELSAQSLQLVPSLDTLTVQVISLENAGRDKEARAVLRANQQVWFTRMDGLLLARDTLADDRELGPRIERRIAKLERERAERTPT